MDLKNVNKKKIKAGGHKSLTALPSALSFIPVLGLCVSVGNPGPGQGTRILQEKKGLKSKTVHPPFCVHTVFLLW